MLTNYVVATIKPWNEAMFHHRHHALSGNWHLINAVEDLTLANLRNIGPKYIFFPHWSWIVPSDILNEFECVCFHMTDLPYGRGGSPLQNLIIRGHNQTQLTALRMTETLDAGPIYLKAPLALSGSAGDIFHKMAKLSWDMIDEIVTTQPVPKAQTGKVTEFQRRTPEQSELDLSQTNQQLYDHIRMLDAPTYPSAFAVVDDKRMMFKNASLSEDGELEVTVNIIQNQKE